MVRSWLFAVLTLALTCGPGLPLRASGYARGAAPAVAQATPVQIPLWAGGAPGFEEPQGGARARQGLLGPQHP
jgi:hypothetical protein